MSAKGTHVSNVGSPGWWAYGKGLGKGGGPVSYTKIPAIPGYAKEANIFAAYVNAIGDAMMTMQNETGVTTRNALVLSVQFGGTKESFECWVLLAQSVDAANIANPPVDLP